MLHPITESLTRACIICTSPRTGSTLLSEALTRTGLLGNPAEYFDIHEKNKQYWVKALGIQNHKEYVTKVIARGTTPNGVFGLKLHWHQIPAMVSSFTAAAGTDTDLLKAWTFDDWLNSHFTSCSYLWLRRRNKVAQAISYFRASQTNVWRVHGSAEANAQPGGSGILFNFDDIDHHVNLVVQADRKWHQFFIRKKIKTLVLIYEDFVANYEATVRAICRFAAVSDDGLSIEPPVLQQQADAISLEWEEEYHKRKMGSTTGTRGSRAPAPIRPNRSAPPALRKTRETNGSAVANPSDAEPLIVAYDVSPQLGVKISNASSRRAWMDAMPERHVYRCLPLVIDNQYGWLLLNTVRFTAVWNGEMGLNAVVIKYSAGVNMQLATSHFGGGIVTFATNFLFRTPPGVNLLVRGPANLPKDGISPLEGLVETDWSEATFTMNWQITRPNYPVEFEKNEPFAMITPITRGDIERYRPEIRLLSQNPDLESGYREWSRSRDAFNRDLKIKNSSAQKNRWQRHYLRGETVTHNKAREHQTAVTLRNFTDKRK